MIAEHQHWMWFVSSMVALVSFGWFGRDVVVTLKYLRKREGVTHDQWFGVLIGLILAGTGIVGFFRYHLGS